MKRCLLIAYVAGAIATSGHSINNPAIATVNQQSGYMMPVIASLLWPFYWSWAVQVRH